MSGFFLKKGNIQERKRKKKNKQYARKAQKKKKKKKKEKNGMNLAHATRAFLSIK